MLCTFSLGNVLRATTACIFSSLIWPDGSEPAALASHKSLEKHSVSRLSYLFAHLDLLSSETFSFLIFSSFPFSSLTLPISAFSSVRIVGSLTSKLPSINYKQKHMYSINSTPLRFNEINMWTCMLKRCPFWHHHSHFSYNCYFYWIYCLGLVVSTSKIEVQPWISYNDPCSWTTWSQDVVSCFLILSMSLLCIEGNML